MRNHYQITRKETENMSIIPFDGRNCMIDTIFSYLPVRIIQHSQRVAAISGILAKCVPEELLPYGMRKTIYSLALQEAGRYHEIGIYTARNDIQRRPIESEKLLDEYWHKGNIPGLRKVVFETIRSCHERCNGKGYPDAGRGMDVPFHANLCAIADAVDMIMGGKFSKRKVRKAVNYIRKNSGILFRFDAVECFERAQGEIFDFYFSLRATGVQLGQGRAVPGVFVVAGAVGRRERLVG